MQTRSVKQNICGDITAHRFDFNVTAAQVIHHNIGISFYFLSAFLVSFGFSISYGAAKGTQTHCTASLQCSALWPRGLTPPRCWGILAQKFVLSWTYGRYSVKTVFPVDRTNRRGEHLLEKKNDPCRCVNKFKIKALRFHSLIDDDVIQTLTEECHRGKYVKLREGDKRKKRRCHGWAVLGEVLGGEEYNFIQQ